MMDDQMEIVRQTDIQFNHVGTGLHSFPECGHRVFRRRS
jgi:hypothetical protein